MSYDTQVAAHAAPRFKAYPAYKDSGVEWLGEIPAHWEVKRLWHLTPSDRRIMYGIVLPGPNVEEGVPIVKGGDVSPERLRLDRLNRTTFEIESSYVRSRLRGGDLVYAIRGSIGEVAIVPNELEGVNLTQDAARIAYTSATHGSWLLHALKSAAVFAQLEAGALGATISGVNIRDLKRASIPVPPRAEQEAIAALLERETARIDALVARKERLIELLQEKRTALITRAVTKGLDQSVRMKDSGVEWLGEIPAHWGVGGLARWWQVIDCKHRTVPFLDEGIALASIGEVQSLEVDLFAAKRTSVEEYRQMISGGREPRRGDVVYSRNATVGAAALVTTEEPFCMGQDVSLIRAADQDQRFLVFLLRSPAVMDQLESSMVGSTFNRINVSKIKRLAVCVPPLEEQQVIAVFCYREHQRVEKLTLKIRDAIDRLKELRTALVSAAVTGKIDVREETPALEVVRDGLCRLNLGSTRMSPRPRVRTFIRVFERSSSLAVHVETDVGEFVVKVRNNPEGPRVLINEWVGTSLARVLGVPTPEFAIVDVPARIEIRLRPGLTGEAGPAFGSCFERAQPWAGKSSMQVIANPEAISRIVVLDTWLRNLDRYSLREDRRVRQNRGNLLLSAEGAPAGQFLLKAIDQGHCFGGTSWQARHLHSIDAIQDHRCYGLFPEFVGHLNAAAVEAALAAAARTKGEDIRALLGQVPREWGLSGEDAGALEHFLIDRAAYLSGELRGILWPQGELGGGKR